MSTDQPTPGSPDDPFAKRPQDGAGAPGGSPYDRPPPDQPPPGDPYASGPYGPPGGGSGPGEPGGPGGPYGENPYAGDPYGGAPDPLAGMPPLAPGGRRLLARIIDIVIVLIPAFLLDWAAVGAQTSDFSTSRSAVGGIFTAGIGFLYEFFLTKSTGQTLGKRAMGLRAAMLDHGEVPTPTASAMRALVLWLPAFFCSCVWFLVIGLSVLLDRPYKQGLEDKAARTVVVQAV